MDLSTTYLGFKLPHPFIVGAGPLTETLDSVKRLEDAGAAAIVMHSLFEEQIKREAVQITDAVPPTAQTFESAASYFPKQREFPSGPHGYLEHLNRIKSAVRVPVIASLNGTTPDGWLKYSKLIEDAGADALELNIYYLPTDPKETGAAAEQRVLDSVRIVKGTVSIPVAVKLSPFYSAPVNLASRLDELGAQGIVIFNRFYQPEVDPDSLDMMPKAHLSKSSELSMRLRWLAILSGQVRASLAVTGGVHTAVDAGRSITAGAHAIQMVSALLIKGPQYLREIKLRLEEWVEQYHFNSVVEMRGCLSLQNCPRPDAYERANYARVLQSWHNNAAATRGD